MQHYLTVCERAARAGGQVLMDLRETFKWREKSPKDLVTEADDASQEKIRQILLGEFPGHDFLGEEQVRGPAMGMPGAEYRWIVDPLDGTSNYVHRLQTFAVSVALERRGELLVGCVFDPVVNECYTALRGGGAFLNGKPIQTSGCTSVAAAMAVASFSPHVPRGSIEITRFVEALHACQAIRRLGSAALNLAYLAAGRLDVYWATSVKSWDVAAGVLLVQEAGGLVTALDGSPFQVQRPELLAVSTRSLQRDMFQVLARAQSAHTGGAGELP